MEIKIGHKIKTLTFMIDQDLRNNDLSLTGGQCFLISFIDKNGGSFYQNKLEEIFKVRRSTLTTGIQTLEKNGYLIRRDVPTDKRKKELILTEKGKAQSEIIKENILRSEKKLINGLEDNELLTLSLLLDKLITNMKETK